MKKIRINELARELEVKAHEILDRLPELGVQEKKTHSSSIDEDVAIKLRRLYGFDVPDLDPNAESDTSTEEYHDEPETAEEEPVVSSAAPMKPVATEEAAPLAAPPAPTPAEEIRPTPGSVAPIRPPLAGRPVHPPVLAHGTARPEFPRPELPRHETPRPPAPLVAPAPQVAPAPPAAPAPQAVAPQAAAPQPAAAPTP
jgi:translation initiation factor IF-2